MTAIILAMLLFAADTPGDRIARDIIVVAKFETESVIQLLRARGYHDAAIILDEQRKRHEQYDPGTQTHWWHEPSYRYFRRLLDLE